MDRKCQSWLTLSAVIPSLLKPLRRFPPAAEMKKGQLAGLADWRSESRMAVIDANGFSTAKSPTQVLSSCQTPPEEVRMYFTHHYALETRRVNQACNLLPLSKPLADKHSAALANGALHFRLLSEFSGGEEKQLLVNGRQILCISYFSEAENKHVWMLLIED